MLRINNFAWVRPSIYAAWDYNKSELGSVWRFLCSGPELEESLDKYTLSWPRIKRQMKGAHVYRHIQRTCMNVKTRSQTLKKKPIDDGMLKWVTGRGELSDKSPGVTEKTGGLWLLFICTGPCGSGILVYLQIWDKNFPNRDVPILKKKSV